MITAKLRHKNFPVIYRWLRRRHYLPYAVLLCCAVLVLPAGIIGGVRVADRISANQALAATRGLTPEHSVLDAISEAERSHYAAALGSLVTQNPEKLYQLIGSDFLVMFQAPDLRRSDGRTVSWQYQAADCVLDLYFQDNADGDESTRPVVHYEVRQRKKAVFGVDKGQQESRVDEKACLDEIYHRTSI